MRTVILSLAALMLGSAAQAAETDERVFRVINAANDLADNSAQVVTCTLTGRMIIGTIGNLNFYDGTEFSHAEAQQDFQYHLPLYRGNYHLYFDTSHHIWLKNTNAVTCLDLMQEQFYANVDSVIRTLGCDDAVQDLFVDDSGGVWFLTERGLYGTRQKQTYNVLRDRNLQDVALKDSTLLLTFYDNGEQVTQDLATGNTVSRTKAYEWDKAQLYATSSVLQPYADGFFQIRNGEKKSVLMFFDAAQQQWSIITEQDYHLNNMALLDDRLYIASEYGYWIYDIATGALQQQELIQMADGNRVLTNCNDLAFDKQGGMWIGTEKRGVLYARPTVASFHALSWSNPQALEYARLLDPLTQNITEHDGRQANCLYIDSRGWTWIGTINGLYLIRSLTDEPIIFTRQQGLFNNVVHSVVEDRKHNIWLSTSRGISCIVFDGGDTPLFVNSFNELDGVPSESFSNNKAMMLDDGTIIMQAVDHVVAFRPESFDGVNIPRQNELFPKMIRLQVNGYNVEPNIPLDDNVIIDRAVVRVKDIYLKSDQNALLITMSALNYFRPLQTFFQVRVQGLDDEWKVFSYFSANGDVDAEGRLHLQLLGLQPGHYILEVKASMFPDGFGDKLYSWNIYVNQPWWETTGVFVIVGSIILALLIVNFILFSRNTRMRARRSSEEGDVVKKIVSFVQRCDSFADEVLAPVQEEMDGNIADSRLKLTPEFIDLMVKLMPVVRDTQKRNLTMRRLSEAGGVDVAHLYEVVTSNIYKSPRDLARSQRIRQAATLLETTDKSIEQIADECRFYTPNYFIGNFFHAYKQTPQEYRRSKR